MEITWLPWILVRLLVPLTIPRWPIVGSVLAVLADMLDIVAWQGMGANQIPEYYNLVDKLLDNYMYLIQGYVAWSWTNRRVRNTALGLLAYRTVGTILYEIFGLRFLLLIFPNVFIWFFMYYLVVKRISGREPMTSNRSLGLTLVVLSLPKLFQEYLFHVAEFPLYQTMKMLLPFLP